MITVRRFVKDESGMTMGLVVIMILLLSVMGAGLLTFVSRDLNTVVEENRGQRALEVADAGIGAAKRQLSSNVVRTSYDDPSGAPVDDIQWSDARGGLTLNDLDGVATTSDSVNVKIKYRGSATDDFRVIAEGTYGNAKRKIEAIFEGVEAGSGSGETIGHPVYYTPSDIKITQDSVANNPVTLNQVSMFSRQNIMIPDHPSYRVTTSAQFATDMSDASGSVKTQGNDALCNWNSKVPAGPTCFQNGTNGNWNTRSRTIQTPGMAAEGKICSYDSSIIIGTCTSTSASIADGVYGFDSTTNPRFQAKDCPDPATCPDNPANTISYPFPLPTPIPAGLKAAACAPPGTVAACTKTPPPVSYFTGTPTNATWGLNTSNASNSRVAFVDAQNRTLTWNPGGGQYKGIIVVWCGRLQMNQSFEGIILNLVGDDLPGNTSCNNDTPTVNASTGLSDGSTVGTYVNAGHSCQCWVYAEGGTTTVPGIQVNPNSTVQFRPSAAWNFQDGLFEGPPPTSFALQGWRELYQ